jgi:hypothetical protein
MVIERQKYLGVNKCGWRCIRNIDSEVSPYDGINLNNINTLLIACLHDMLLDEHIRS